MGRAGGGSRGGGGSRSSGGGGSRSRSSGSSSRAGSGRSSSYSSSRGSSFSSPSYRGSSFSYSNVNIGNSYGSRSGSYGEPITVKYGSPVASPTVIIAVVIVIAALILTTFLRSDSGPKSTIVRERIDSGYSFDSKCIKDEIGWFDSTASTGRKLSYFYEKTGVQPYIYLKAYDSTLTNLDAKKAYAEDLYKEMFGDRQDVFLYIYFAKEDQNNDVGDEAWWIGQQAGSVLDNEAMDIFWHKLDALWFTNISTDDLYTNTFEHTADKIMQIDKGPWAIIAIIVGVAGAICAFIFIFSMVKEKNRRAKEEAEETVRILNADIDKLAESSGDEDLVDKYS